MLKLAALVAELVLGSERRIVDARGRVRFDHVVRREIFIEAMDLIAIAGLEQIEEGVDEVVDLDGGFVTELWQLDRRGVVVVMLDRHVGVR
ncbi:MAG TPA: hypothetical protein VMN83_10000 [Albitalea sp.]|nr:hypothetical protein [Albitalea sp.]